MVNIDKKRFLYLLNNYRSLTNKETTELVVLQKHFPYSQAIRNMTTWGVYHNDLPTRKAQLHIATIYATDRKLLKTLITAPPIKRRPAAKPPQKTDVQPKILEETKINQPIPIDPLIDKLLDNLPKELIELKKRREEFEQTVKTIKKNKDNNRNATERIDGNKSKTTTTRKRVAIKTVGKKKPQKKKTKKTTKVAVKKKIADKPLKKERKKAIKKTIAPKKTAPIKKKIADKPVKKNISQREKPIKRKLSPTKTSKAKKIKSKQPPQQKQKKVIDTFILAKPKIPKANPKTTELEDLSKMSHVLNKRAISETLVQVLIAQGKKNEAIEILKKLIWKMPQKKARFLAQIKALESLP